MKHTNFHKISPKETREKWARVFFVCMFVTSYNFETTTHACASMAFWRHLARLRGRSIVLIFKLLSWTLRHVFGDENLEWGILSLGIGCLASCIWVMTAAQKIWLFFAILHLFASFSRVSSVKYLETRQSCKNDFGQHFNLKKMKNLSTGFLKIVQFHIFD